MNNSRSRFLSPLTFTLLLSASCAGSDPEPSAGTGGATGSGGAKASGGATGSGGTSPGTGGAAPGSGGSPAVGTGGRNASGGAGVGTGGAGTGGSGTGGSGSGGRAATGGAGGSVTGTGGRGTGGAGTGGAGGSTSQKFSFFVTSIAAMRKASNNQNGFGGDLRYGQTTGLAGADKLCTDIAEAALPGAGAKTWRAFLSTVAGPVHAIDRVGNGPWYDRMGRLVANTKADLLHDRPVGANAAIVDDLPNENGIPNHTDGAPGCSGNACPDNHDTLTGTNTMGQLYSQNKSNTCNDWTSGEATNPGGRGLGPWCGHSWPRQGSGVNWMSALAEGGCGPGVNLVESGGPQNGVYTVGTGGGYGGIYCFALTP